LCGRSSCGGGIAAPQARFCGSWKKPNLGNAEQTGMKIGDPAGDRELHDRNFNREQDDWIFEQARVADVELKDTKDHCQWTRRPEAAALADYAAANQTARGREDLFSRRTRMRYRRSLNIASALGGVIVRAIQRLRRCRESKS